MTIPKYHELYRPFLSSLLDGKSHPVKEIKETVLNTLGITEEEKSERLPSGKQYVFDNRIGWARTYLKKAGLIESPSRGVFAITSEGVKLMGENLPVIDDDTLMRYESFRLFKKASANEKGDQETVTTDGTPLDILDQAFQVITVTLADEVLSEIIKQSPSFFEKLVVKLLEKMGYGGTVKEPGTVLGKSGDEGIDGIIREDKLGFNLIYIQAKRWDLEQTIGRPEIQKFVGALAGHGATKGLFITTARFSKEAMAYALKQHTTKVILVDGAMLAQLMIENNLGVSTQTVYEIKRLDSDFFSDDE